MSTLKKKSVCQEPRGLESRTWVVLAAGNHSVWAKDSQDNCRAASELLIDSAINSECVEQCFLMD